MKHCVKKLLSLAFALALCLAVGGTALAETPMLAAVLAALPGQEMLDYEQNVTTAEDTTTIGDIATDGYQVTIPTTVEVKSGTNKGELEVNAKLKQYRTLNIGIASQNDWKLQYDGATAGATTPEVDYKLSQGTSDGANTDCEWEYQPERKKLSFSTTKMQPGASLEADMERLGSSSYKLPITVLTPSQATMSGTYSDTLEFTFSVEKKLVTYTIKAYGQKLALTTDDTFDVTAVPATKRYIAIHAVDVVNEGVAENGAEPVSTVTVEYPRDGEAYTWTRLRPTDNKAEDERCWENLTYNLNPTTDFSDSETTKTINLNLERKWCWLDVNGVTEGDSGDPKTTGTQGTECIAGYVDIRVSADNGETWSGWYWYRYGDDYWGTFPYGTVFQLGLHHVKDGYVYDEDAPGGNVKIYANGNPASTTTTSAKDENTTYRVYQGTLKGEPVDTALHTTEWGGYYHDGAVGKSLPRYCYNPCYKKGITYDANGGTDGTEDTYVPPKPHSNVPYDATDTLKTTDALGITPPAGKSLAGWSTKRTYTKGDTLYQVGDKVSNVTSWDDDYTGEESLKRRPEFGGQKDAENRTLYAIWGYDITVQFEDEKGYSTNDGRGPVATRGGTMDGYSFTLKGQAVDEDKGWTLDLTDPKVTAAIDKATTKAKFDAGDNRATTTSDDVWKTDIEYKLSAAEVKSGKPLVIKRRRYLLSVISALTDTGNVLGVGKNPVKDEYGTFKIIVNNDSTSTLSNNDTSFYQQGLNYGASYTVSDPKPLDDTFVYSDYVILQSLAVGNQLGSQVTQDNIEETTSYSSHVTGKKNNVHYYKPGELNPEPVYTGDPVRVAFWKKTTTGSTTPMPGPSLAPAKKALTLRYHANFDPTEELELDLDPDPLLEDMDDTFGFDPAPLPEDVDDALEEAVKTVRYQPGEDVVLRNCMFKRGGYVFVGWNTEPDGTGRLYRVNGVPITDWADGDTVDLYAQWKKPEHLKPVVDSEPFVPADPDTPPERVDDGFDADFGADPDPLPEGMDDAFGV